MVPSRRKRLVLSIYRTLLTHLTIDTWLFAGLAVARTIATGRGIRRVPDLLDRRWDKTPSGNPRLVVIVPARNEGSTIEPALRSLLAQDYPNLHLLVVDDRSTDATPAILDRFAAEHPARLTVLHIEELPSGWLGKTHAMSVAAEHAQAHFHPDFLLFTDADVHFRPDALRRSLVAAIHTMADHFVTLPTPVAPRADEAAFLSFFQVLSLFAVRLWCVPDPRAVRDSVGVGAFALLRTSAYVRLGGFAALRMEILEDLYLGRRVKALGMRQRTAFGRDLVRVHWAPGALGIVGVLTKNMFALFRFRLWLVLFVAFWLFLFSVGPVLALLLPQARIAAILIAVCAVYCYRLMSRFSGISAWNVVFAPLAGTLLTWSLLRSTWTTLRQGGVQWRGTFYSLRELRAHAGPLTNLRSPQASTRNAGFEEIA